MKKGNEILDKILLKNYYLEEEKTKDPDYPYLATKLLNTFGVVVDKPSKLTSEHVKLISDFYGINIPEAFYSNPQDMKLFSCSELELEQLVSYFLIDFLIEEDSLDSLKEENFKRIELFKKALPNYEEGKEIKLRTYKIITKEEKEKFLLDYTVNLAGYTRKWSETEEEEFVELYKKYYYKDTKIESKDNAVALFNVLHDEKFAKYLDQKDVVKLSVSLKDEKKILTFSEEEKEILRKAITNCYSAKLSKKQAKFFNTLIKHLGVKIAKRNNNESPYKKATLLVKEKNIVEAAEEFAKNGSLLERNLCWLLSRATKEEAKQILEMVKAENPIVLIQLYFKLALGEREGKRIFSFYKNRKQKKHEETDNEKNKRKSVLSDEMLEFVKAEIKGKIFKFYSSLPKLGKIYIEEKFKKIALPLNTSASGSGLDIIPAGSRLPINGDYIRTFVYWDGIYDVDSSVTFIHNTGKRELLYWGNYSKKMFGDSALSSGDDRSKHGSEYNDFKITELQELGYEYAICSLNAYQENFLKGEVFTGYQNKDNLETKVWSPKNIEMKMKVRGESTRFMSFAIDLQTKEIIMLNTMQESNERVVLNSDLNGIKKYLERDFLDFINVYSIAELRGDLVEDPSEADLIFSDADIEIKEGQTLIKSSSIEKLVNFLK